MLQPQAVLALMPSVRATESDSAREVLRSRLAEPLISPNGANPSPWLVPRPRLRPAVSVTEAESVTESAVPTVLV